MEFNLSLKYKDGKDTGAVITNYKPPTPTILRKKHQSLSGYTIFQEPCESDTLIKFSVAFETHTQNEIETFKEFRNKFNELFIFIDEFRTEYRGYFQGNFDLETPIEGDIYYVSCELLCPCPINGWKAELANGL